MAKAKSSTKKHKTEVRLLHFLSDVARVKKLQRAIVTNPQKAMKDYGLSRAHVKTLKSGNHRKIASAIVGELKGVGGRKPPVEYPFPRD